MKLHFLHTILISLLTGFSLYAQEYYISHYTTEDGLLSQEVNCVFQDSIGQLWVGTNGGLHLFDGVDFKPLKRGIPSRYIRDIKATKDQELVLSHDAGLSLVEPMLETFSIIESSEILNQQQHTPLNYPNSLHIDRNNRIWVSQPNGELLRMDKENKAIILKEKPDVKDPNLHYSFAAVNNHDFLVASPGGSIYLWEEMKGELIFLGKTSPIKHILYHSGKLYVAGENLTIYDDPMPSGKLEVHWSNNEKMGSLYSALASDSLGRVFVGTAGNGLFEISEENKTYGLKEVFSNNDPHRVDRLPFKHINSIFISNDNSIWVSSNEGLGLLQRRFFEGAQNLPNDNATTLAQADNGDIYIAMGDVYVVKKRNQDYIASKLDVPNVGAFNALAVDGPNLWAGTNNGQVVKMDLNGKKKKIFPFSKRGAGVFRICADSESRKWFCQAPKEHPIFGLAMIDKEDQLHLYGKEKGFDNRMLIVKEGPRKEIYAAGIGPTSYLYKYFPEKDEFINMSIPLTFPISQNFEVHDIAIDEQGLVWLATTDGLLRHDMENIIRPELGAEFTGKEVRAVAVFPDKSLWISTDIYGMLRYKDGKVLSLGEDAGLPTKIMAYRGLLADKDLKLWINTLEGVAFTSQNPPLPLPTSIPFLNSITYNNDVLDRSTLNYELIKGGKLKLNYVSLVYPGNFTKYQYALVQDGSPQWIDLGIGNEATILIDDIRIKELKIRARKSGGYDWSEPLNITLEVLLPWYKRTSYLLLFSLLGVILFFILWRANNKQLHKKITHLELSLKEKNDLQGSTSTTKEQELDFQVQEVNIEKRILMAAVNLVSEVTDHTYTGMIWDHVLEHLSIAFMKLPHTVAFEVGILNKATNRFTIEGYSLAKNGFYQRAENWSDTGSLYAKAVKSQLAKSYSIDQSRGEDLDKWTGKFTRIITVPFIQGHNRNAVICVYGSKKLDNKHILKAIKSVANYLELIQ